MDLGANGLADLPLHPPARVAQRARRRGVARIRALVGRGHRDDLHGRRQYDDPDLDLDGPAHRRQRLRDQRRRRRRRAPEHRAGVLRPAPDERRGRPSRRRLAVAPDGRARARVGAHRAGGCLPAAACGIGRLDDEPAARRPLRARGDAAARGGRAAPAGAPGLRRELVGEAVRAQHRLPRRGALRQHRRRACGAPPTAGASTSPRSPAGSPTPSSRTARRARSTPPSCRSAPSFRAPFRDPAAGRAGVRRYGVAFMWSPRLLLWRKTIRKHAPATWAPLSWNTKARARTRRARGHAAPDRRRRGRAAQARPLARDRRPLRARREPVRRGAGADEAAPAAGGRALAVPGDEIDAFDGGLVDVGAGDWYTAQQIRDQNVDVGLTLPREGAPGEVDLWMLGAARPPPRLRVPLDALRLGSARAGPGGALLRRHAGQRRRLRPARQSHLPRAARRRAARRC